MKHLLYWIIAAILFSTCTYSQTDQMPAPRLVGGPCEGCEAIFEFDAQTLSSSDTLPDFIETGQQLKISGTIYEPDGKTPAKDVVLYVYHTDQMGYYSNRENKNDWSGRHGYIRGGMKTGADGRYVFYTLIPGVYPDRAAAAHIHPTILEPSGKYYWVEDYYFAGDSLLTEKEKRPVAPRGGTAGVLQLQKEGNLWTAERDFILGKNVIGY